MIYITDPNKDDNNNNNNNNSNVSNSTESLNQNDLHSNELDNNSAINERSCQTPLSSNNNELLASLEDTVEILKTKANDPKRQKKSMKHTY